jgi:hypothetical protein
LPNDVVMRGVCFAIGVAGAVFPVLTDFGSPYADKTGVVVAGVVTAVVAAGGAALGVVVRMLSGRVASPGEWIRRSAGGALLLTPAALVLTRTFLGDGWDFDDCGTLLAPNRPDGAALAGFRAACDEAADGRVIRLLAWVAVGSVVAGGYGLWLRHRGRRHAAA